MVKGVTTPTECEVCGAPAVAGLVACSYCDAPYPGMADGVSCPGCGDDNAPSRPRCASCGVSLMRGCVFCAMTSSVGLAACGHCGEAFDGAEQRKAERDEQAQQQQLIGLAAQGLGVLGQVAAGSNFGGGAGKPAGGGWGGGKPKRGQGGGDGLLGEIWDDLSDAAMGKK